MDYEWFMDGFTIGFMNGLKTGVVTKFMNRLKTGIVNGFTKLLE